MADIIDQANELRDLLTSAAVSSRPRPLPFIGRCYNCEEKIGKGHFCDAGCKEDYEKRVYAESQRRIL